MVGVISQMAMTKDIETFAFLDLETSSLPDLNFGKTSITEFSLIACRKENIENPLRGEKLPRSVHKLTLCFNPAARIAPVSTELSGLDNYMLENQNKFDENAANVIKCFIKHLPQPVCLVAHNGDQFDYPVLKKHMQKVGVDIPEDVLCMDSLPACRTIDRVQSPIRSTPGSALRNNVELTTQPQSGSQGVENDKIFQETLHDEYINILNYEGTNITTATTTTEKVDWQKLNETTPRRSGQGKFGIKRSILGIDDTDCSPSKKTFKSRRELFPTNSPQTPTGKGAYKLENIYERIVGEKPKKSHRAEKDVANLIEVAMAYGKEFIKYAQCNAILFSDIPVLGSK